MQTNPSIRLRQDINVAGLKFGEAAQDFWRKREDMN
jgi:hypothetical protein